MVQIRNVPDDMHSELKARAAREGMSLSDFLKRELGRILERKSLAEAFEEMAPYRVNLTREDLLDAIDAARRDHR